MRRRHLLTAAPALAAVLVLSACTPGPDAAPTAPSTAPAAIDAAALLAPFNLTGRDGRELVEADVEGEAACLGADGHGAQAGLVLGGAQPGRLVTQQLSPVNTTNQQHNRHATQQTEQAWAYPKLRTGGWFHGVGWALRLRV